MLEGHYPETRHRDPERTLTKDHPSDKIVEWTTMDKYWDYVFYEHSTVIGSSSGSDLHLRSKQNV